MASAERMSLVCPSQAAGARTISAREAWLPLVSQGGDVGGKVFEMLRGDLEIHDLGIVVGIAQPDPERLLGQARRIGHDFEGWRWRKRRERVDGNAVAGPAMGLCKRKALCRAIGSSRLGGGWSCHRSLSRGFRARSGGGTARGHGEEAKGGAKCKTVIDTHGGHAYPARWGSGNHRVST